MVLLFHVVLTSATNKSDSLSLELGRDWNVQESFTDTSYVGWRPGHLCSLIQIRPHFLQYLEHLPYSMVVQFHICEYGRCHFSLDLELAQRNFCILLVNGSYKARLHSKEK